LMRSYPPSPSASQSATKLFRTDQLRDVPVRHQRRSLLVQRARPLLRCVPSSPGSPCRASRQFRRSRPAAP
jgi:hypothetical protein